MNVNANLMAENVIQIKNGIMINIHVSVANIIHVKNVVVKIVNI